MERVHQRRAHGHHGHPGSLRIQRRLANQSKYPVSFHSLLFLSPGVSLPSRDAGASLFSVVRLPQSYSGYENREERCIYSSPWDFCLTNIEGDIKDYYFWFSKVSKRKQNTCNRLQSVTKWTISVTYLLESIISVNKKYGVMPSSISKRNTCAVKTLQNESKSIKTLSICTHK